MKRALHALLAVGMLAGCASTGSSYQVDVPALKGAQRVPINSTIPDTVPYTVPAAEPAEESGSIITNSTTGD